MGTFQLALGLFLELDGELDGRRVNPAEGLCFSGDQVNDVIGLMRELELR